MKLILILLVALQVPAAMAQPKAVVSEVKLQKTWSQYRKEILNIQNKYADKKMSLEKKMDLLPQANEVLSEIQDLKLSKIEKGDMIHIVVDFLAASQDIDVTNSHCDTLFDHYEANKNSYNAEFKKQPKAVREKLLDTFEGLKDSTAPESEAESE